MSSVVQPKTYPVYDPVHLIGTVKKQQAQEFVVECDGYEWVCRRAASCLLQPQIGDTVLISGPERERVYLIAVIEQAQQNESTVNVPGRLNISADSVNIQSAAAMQLHGGTALDLTTAQLKLSAKTGQCVVEDMTYAGREVKTTVGMMRVIGKVYESIMDRLSFMSRTSFKLTEEVEHLRAGTIDYQAEQSARLHSKYTVVTAKDLVKVDGKQIHMG
ncbi:hypothetical protein CAP48_00150 [Advenella sp. S44]|uniref:DUF3540 domain-containing protein n=1 Tax=Advenella sp. S44 TaxID=1982755 RepID=UPI000C2ABD44|nr:DUF3540 domain-containing protein [Advenella sp. S44]PJX27648.1 hypothetical protein CAP48_00150 [Advenella sp. S44]